MRTIKGKRGGSINLLEKGETANPMGRPKGHLNRVTIAKKWLEIPTKIENPETGKPESATIEDKIFLSLIKKGLKGDVNAIREIFEMKYGKPTQQVDLQVETPRTVEWIRVERNPNEVAHSEQEIKDREGL